MNGKRGPEQKYPRRANVRLTDDQYRYLEEEATRNKLSVADVVRRLIDAARKR